MKQLIKQRQLQIRSQKDIFEVLKWIHYQRIKQVAHRLISLKQWPRPNPLPRSKHLKRWNPTSNSEHQRSQQRNNIRRNQNTGKKKTFLKKTCFLIIQSEMDRTLSSELYQKSKSRTWRKKKGIKHRES